jgi:hypothetical protein
MLDFYRRKLKKSSTSTKQDKTKLGIDIRTELLYKYPYNPINRITRIKGFIEMPAPEASLVSPNTESNVSFSLEPAFNALHSLMLLTKVDHLSGLDEWVTRTAAALPPDRRLPESRGAHRRALCRRTHAQWSSFPLYLDNLARRIPLSCAIEYLRPISVSARKKADRPLD